MSGRQSLHWDLKPNLCALVSGTYSREQVNHAVRVAHALSTAFLASKRSSGILMNLHGLNLRDLAYDCIAEIFQQNGENRFIQLEAYFSSLEMHQCCEEELLAHFRRLVFSKVNHGVFRLYNEADPMLSRILRNTKLAIASLGQFTEVERFGELCIAPAMCDTLEQYPPLEREDIERRLIASSSGIESVPTLLSRLSLCVREQESHCRIIPLVMIAHIIRAVYESKRYASAGNTEGTPEHSMRADDILGVINEVCHSVGRTFEKKYVGRKIQPELFASYMHAIREGLIDRFVQGDGTEASLYERLERVIRGLTKEDYRKHHRARLEYLNRHAHDMAVERLRKEMQ